MLQWFDDLPDDRWAAFLYVERRGRELFKPSLIGRRRFVQWILVAAHELNLRILPHWQSQPALLYRVIAVGINEDDKDGEREFAEFESDLAA